METQREFSTQTEKGNQLDEDDGTYNRILIGGLEERDINTEQKVLETNLNYFNDEFLFKFHICPKLRAIVRFYDPMGLI